MNSLSFGASIEAFTFNMVASDYNYLLIGIIGMGVLFLAGLLPVVTGQLLGWRKPPLWYPLLLCTAGALFFLMAMAISLKVPAAYSTYHDQVYKDKYLGNPDTTAGNCPVYEGDGNTYRLEPLLDEDGVQLKRPLLDDSGMQVYDENNNPVFEPVFTKVKVKYELLARPFGPDLGLRSIFLLLGHRTYPEYVHLCKLPFNKPNYEFMKGAQEKWDEIHGTEPEDPSEKKGQQGEEENPDRPREGQPGNPSQEQGEPSEERGNSKKPPIDVELPDQNDEETPPPGSDAEEKHQEEMRKGKAEVRKDPGEARRRRPGEGMRNQDQQELDSEGGIEVPSPGHGLPPKRFRD